MNYAFETLMTVSFKHGYFSNQTFGGFAVEPIGLTANEMLRHGLLLKQFTGGFHILFDTNFAGDLRNREQVLNDQVLCQFVLRLSDKAFYNYTEPVEGDITKSIYHFHNTSTNRSAVKNSLHTDSYVSAKDLFPLDDFADNFFVKPFAKLELLLGAGLEQEYSLNFKAKETYWRYILVSEELTTLTSPAIRNSANAEFFDGPEKIAVRGKETLAFKSKKPISFSQNPDNIFQLVDNYDEESGRYKVVMRALPAADPNHITLLDAKPHNETLNYSEIFIH